MRNLFRSTLVTLALALGLFAAPAQAASGMHQYLANALLNNLFRGTTYTFPSTLYVRLYKTCPSDSTSGTEVNGTGYSAPTFNPSTSNWGAAACAASSAGTLGNCNATAISFGTSDGTANWNIQCAGVTDSTPNVLFWGAASPTGAPSSSTAVSIAQSNLTISIAMALPEVQEYLVAGLAPFDALRLAAEDRGIDTADATLAISRAAVETVVASGQVMHATPAFAALLATEVQ